MEPAVLAAYDHCGLIIRRAAKTFYWGSRLLPQRQRLASWALYAFCRSVDDIADEATDVAQAKAQLAVWRDRLTRAYRGQSSGPNHARLVPYAPEL